MRASCPVCNSTGAHWKNLSDVNRKLSLDEFDYHRCPNCGSIFLSLVPANLSFYYQTSEYHRTPATIQCLEEEAQAQQYRVEFVKEFVPRGRLLDVGCGYGLFLYQAKKSGYDVEGLEMEPGCVTYLTTQLGVKAVCSNSPHIALKNIGPYDVITFWHSLEHLAEPVATMRAAVTRLSSGGILVITVPNPEAFQFRLLGKYWAHLDAPRHLQLIPLATLSRLLAEMGLTRVMLTCNDPIGVYCNHFGWVRSLSNLCENRNGKRLMVVLGRVLERLFYWVEHSDLGGSTFTVIYRKVKTDEVADQASRNRVSE